MTITEIDFPDVRPGDLAQHHDISLDPRRVTRTDVDNEYVWLLLYDEAGPFPAENYTFYSGRPRPREYRKRPAIIEAVRWSSGLSDAERAEVLDWMTGTAADGPKTGFRVEGAGGLVIRTLEGDMRVSDGDWIIKGVKGELYPCKPDVFEQTYEEL